MLGIGTEAGIFLYAGQSGAVVFLAYGVLVCFRKIVPHRNLAAGLEDLAFWLIVSGYLFRQMYETTYGSIRWFFVLGVVCGALLAYAAGILAKKMFAIVKKILEKFKKNR